MLEANEQRNTVVQLLTTVYRRLGFLPVCSFQTYTWEPDASVSEG